MTWKYVSEFCSVSLVFFIAFNVNSWQSNLPSDLAEHLLVFVLQNSVMKYLWWLYLKKQVTDGHFAQGEWHWIVPE